MNSKLITLIKLFKLAAITIKDRNHAAQILGINATDPIDVIDKKYKELIKLNHPDKFVNQGKEAVDEATEKMKKINLAYGFLKKINPEKISNWEDIDLSDIDFSQAGGDYYDPTVYTDEQIKDLYNNLGDEEFEKQYPGWKEELKHELGLEGYNDVFGGGNVTGPGGYEIGSPEADEWQEQYYKRQKYEKEQKQRRKQEEQEFNEENPEWISEIMKEMRLNNYSDTLYPDNTPYDNDIPEYDIEQDRIYEIYDYSASDAIDKYIEPLVKLLQYNIQRYPNEEIHRKFNIKMFFKDYKALYMNVLKEFINQLPNELKIEKNLYNSKEAFDNLIIGLIYNHLKWEDKETYDKIWEELAKRRTLEKERRRKRSHYHVRSLFKTAKLFKKSIY